MLAVVVAVVVGVAAALVPGSSGAGDGSARPGGPQIAASKGSPASAAGRITAPATGSRTGAGRPAAPATAVPAPARTARQRPNIVFVLTDDLSMDLVRYMPQVQALEGRGMTFDDYFVSDSLCCPSRSSIFTGKLPARHRRLHEHRPRGRGRGVPRPRR